MPASASYANKKEQAVHQLIEASFSGQEFDRFCFHYYPVLYYQFSPNMGNAAKIRVLIKYAEQRKQLGQLVNSIQSTKPQEYHAFVQHIRAAAKTPAPTPSTSPRLDYPDRTIEPQQYTVGKPLIPTWALLVVLVVFVIFFSEPLYLSIEPLYADTKPLLQQAIVVLENVTSQEIPVPAVEADLSAAPEQVSQITAGAEGENDQPGLTNSDEAVTALPPENPDTDGDGLDDKTEREVLNTNPLSPDTDADSLADNDEIRLGFDPFSGDTDGDGTADAVEADPSRLTASPPTPVALPGPQFKEPTYNVNEQDGKATITIRLVAAAENQVVINYNTIENGTAKAGEDYITTSGRLVFNPGQVNGVFFVPITNDSRDEAIETVGLELSGFGQTDRGPNTTQSTLLVQDDDEVGIRFSQSQPALSLLQVEPPRYLVSENKEAIIVVELAAPADQPIRVGYATEDGSARAAEDYTPVQGTLTFNPGETRMRFSVSILPDQKAEDPEVINLILSSETGANSSRAELVIAE